MIRYDKVDKKDRNEIKDKNEVNSAPKEMVRYTKENIQKLHEIFKGDIKKLQIGQLGVVQSIDDENIYFNRDIDLDIFRSVDAEVIDRADFVKKFLIFNFDDLNDRVFGKDVIVVQEPTFSIFQTTDEYIVKYDFIN